MKTVTKIIISSALGVSLAASMVSPVYAWHPDGKIKKYVQNITSGSEMSDASGESTAIKAKPGDILRYSITVTNKAKPAEKQYNDLAYVIMTDSLPEGVELVGQPAQREIIENLGTILPGASITKHYDVKVVATKHGYLIENKACFTGDSVVKDKPQKGCDVAMTVLDAQVTPAPTPAPVKPQSPAPQKPAVLPATGPSSVIALVAFTAVIGYASNLLRLRLVRD